MNTEPIRIAPDKVAVIIGDVDGQGLLLGIRADCPPPLGRVDLLLGYETAVQLALSLTEALALTDDERDDLRRSITAGEGQL